MQLTNNKNEINKIKRLLEIKELNIASSNALFEFSFSSMKPEDILSFLELDLSNQEDEFFYNNYFLNNIVPLSHEDYESDLYRKRLNNINIKKGNYSIKNLIIKKYQTFPYDDIEVDLQNDYLERSRIGYFLKDYSYPALMKNNTVWMSVDPSEVNTMRPYINDSKGHLLVFGLGMGYFPYLSSKNKDVKDITIIEYDQNIIDLFKQHLLPKLDFSCPIKIIKDDAFNYIKNNDMNRYDTLFMDIWHNPEDGLPLYLKFKSLLKGYKGQQFYWLNKSLIAMLRRCYLTVIEEQLNGSGDKDYMKSENEYDRIINALYFYTKNTIIDTYQELLEHLSDENLENIASNLHL